MGARTDLRDITSELQTRIPDTIDNVNRTLEIITVSVVLITAGALIAMFIVAVKR